MLPVRVDERPCGICDLPILPLERASVALRAGGQLRWCHQVCAVNANGGQSAMRPTGTRVTAIAAQRTPQELTVADMMWEQASPRIVHLADLHLGFRAYQRLTPWGQNQREFDVERTMTNVVDQVIALAPDIILIAGDVFHASHPSNYAITLLTFALRRLREALPQCTIVIIAGNHDLPRSGELGNILANYAWAGDVVIGKPRRIDLPQFDLSILAVPEHEQPVLEPDPDRAHNVLLLHGEVEYVEPNTVPAFDYVALGHYHVHRLLTPTMAYAGSIDYTSTNPWGELAEERAAGLAGKGFLVVDNFADGPRFVPTESVRTYLDVPEIDGAGKTSEELDAMLRTVASDPAIDGAVVRVTIRDAERAVARNMDQAALRQLKARALHFQLTTHRPAPTITVDMGGRAKFRGKRLEDIVRDGMAKRTLQDGVDRTALTNMALMYLDKAGEQEVNADTPTEASAT